MTNSIDLGRRCRAGDIVRFKSNNGCSCEVMILDHPVVDGEGWLVGVEITIKFTADPDVCEEFRTSASHAVKAVVCEGLTTSIRANGLPHPVDVDVLTINGRRPGHSSVSGAVS